MVLERRLRTFGRDPERRSEEAIMATTPARIVTDTGKQDHPGGRRIEWRPLTGLIHPYRENAIAEIEAALPDLARGRSGVPVRVKYTVHGYQAQLGVLRPETAEEVAP
jgi:hypothetical protein